MRRYSQLKFEENPHWDKEESEEMEEVDDDSLELKYLPNKQIKRKKPKYEVMEANDTHKVIRNRNLRMQARKKEETLVMRKDGLKEEDDYVEQDNPMLPKILRDFKTNKVFLNKRGAEEMGLKYHLGHTGNLA